MSEESIDPGEPANRTLASPNRVLWLLCGALQRLAQPLPDGSTPRELVEQNGVLAIFLAMSAIEAFTNVYFRVVAENPAYASARQTILDELQDRHIPTGVKLTRWCVLAFNRPVNQSDPRWARFHELRDLRNALVHFRSSHETIFLPGNVVVNGLADTTLFTNITPETPTFCLQCVIGIVEIVGECKGIASERMPQFVGSLLGVI